MKKILKLNKGTVIGVDTNIFIYHFDRSSTFHQTAQNHLAAFLLKRVLLVTSSITLTELLSFNVQEKLLTKLEQEFLSIPNLTILEVNNNIAIKAAQLRRKHKFPVVDSIQLATAIHAQARIFITNDKILKRYKELRVILLTDL